MATVFVLSEDGKPLMPTTRCGHVRQLLKQNKARVVATKPFTIKLLYGCPEGVQPLVLGIDPGRTNIGVSVVKEDGTVVFSANLETRNKEIPKLMAARKVFRQKHRSCRRRQKRQRRAIAAGTLSKKLTKSSQSQSGMLSERGAKIGVMERRLPGQEKPVLCIGIKNKEARFCNRKRPAGWLTPTARQLLQTHLNLVRRLQKVLPISKIVIEVNRFAFMAMDNPKIKRWEYQKGPLYKMGSLEEAVANLQGGVCLLCGELPIDNYHHVVSRRKNGSNTIGNIAGLCACCHDVVHKDATVANKLATLKQGINKKYGALSVLNQIIPFLLNELPNMASEVCVTVGQSTKAFRDEHNLSKDHWLDAYCIACSVLPTVKIGLPETIYQYRQFRRHDRQACHQERINRKYLLDGKIVCVNRRKAIEQTIDSLEEFRANHSDREVSLLTVKPHPAEYKNMRRIMPGALMKFQAEQQVLFGTQGTEKSKNGRVPGYAKFKNDRKARYSQCCCVYKNSGLVCI